MPALGRCPLGRWGDVELRRRVGFITVHRSKTDQEGEGALQLIGPEACADLETIRPPDAGDQDLVFGVSDRTISRRIRQAAIHANLGDGFSGHSPRVGMAKDLSHNRASLPEMMQAGRWRSARMVAEYTREQEASRGAVAKYYNVPEEPEDPAGA